MGGMAEKIDRAWLTEAMKYAFYELTSEDSSHLEETLEKLKANELARVMFMLFSSEQSYAKPSDVGEASYNLGLFMGWLARENYDILRNPS